MAVDSDFEVLYQTVFPRLVSLGTLKTGRADIAHELAQETMARAHARWHEIGSYDSPAAWCRTVMVNLLIDHHRTRVAEGRALERAGTPDNAADAAGPALSAWTAMMQHLPERQQLIVTLYYADDLTIGQIAQLLDTTRGGVKASLFKARRTLCRQLEPDGDADG